MTFTKKTISFNRKTLLVLLAVFVVSVLIRLPNLNRPLSKHHEFITAVSLRVLQVWDKEPPSNFHFSPVMNYPGKANKWINNHASPKGNMLDENGNYYYISHPPLAYLLPHYTFKILHVKPTVLSLQLFLVFCSLITGIFVYLIALYSWQNQPIEKRQQVGCIAFSLYMLSPAVLWFQGNTYMSDILVHTFFASTIYFCIRAVQQQAKSKWTYLFSFSLFFMIYTSWLGVFLAFCIALFGLFRWKKNDIRKIFLPTILVTSASLALIFWQYSTIAGMDNLLAQLFQRMDIRGSNSSENSDSFFVNKGKEVGLLIMNYGILYFPLLLLLVWNKLSGLKNALQSTNRIFTLLSIVPILVLHLALLNYSGHDFTSLYASLFLSVFCAIILLNLSARKRKLIFSAIIILNVSSYYFVNRPGGHSWKGDVYAESMNKGLEIKRQADPDKTVFFVTDNLDPMVVVYAERNIIAIQNEADIQKWTKSLGIEKWQVIELEE